ncbi:MAG TPA: hypothetical protein VGM56_12830, partial [Byssovorax sp.]
PPMGARAGCPGTPALATFEVAGSTSHRTTLAPVEIDVVGSPREVDEWATARGLTTSTPLFDALGALGATSFVVARFSHAAGESTTQTIRVVSPGGDAHVPLTLVRGGVSSDVLVTVFQLAEGRGTLTPTTAAVLPASSVSWEPASGLSDYTARRADALATSSAAIVEESAGHGGLVSTTNFGQNAGSIDGLVPTYFLRGATYAGDATPAAACTGAAITALGQATVVGNACPAGALATVGALAPCDESTANGELDPSTMRCADDLDDLAIGVSGLTAANVWLTRQTMLVERASGGPDLYASAQADAEVTPIVVSGRVDLVGCDEGPMGSSGGDGNQSTGSGNQTGTGDQGTNSSWYDGSSDGTSTSDGNWSSDGSGDGEVDLGAGSDDASSTSSGSCSGSTDTSASSDSCDGSSDSSGDSCDGGSSSGDSCDAGDAGDGCSGGGSGDFGDCTLSFGGHKPPRASILIMGAIFLLAPLRRRGTQKRAVKVG